MSENGVYPPTNHIIVSKIMGIHGLLGGENPHQFWGEFPQQFLGFLQ
jgi:hypothetical protein